MAEGKREITKVEKVKIEDAAPYKPEEFPQDLWEKALSYAKAGKIQIRLNLKKKSDKN